ncbi:MAG: DUF924 domain-containing protein [Bdellovibrionales bacterium]|nr:DUF924 domain-containing protein [Bdellovibrionales bacterium]
MATPQEILHFWFQELDAQKRFAKSDELDQTIRDRFLQTYKDVVNDKTASWRTTPEGRLAEIIVLDQFSRNMFRDTAKAFSSDGLALELAEAAVAVGDDQKLPAEQRAFIYMPYMHSESRAVHETAVTLFSQKGLEYNLNYEMMHKKIIDRFGRYPHRNALLGRISTPEETAFLKEPGSSF